MNKKEAIAFLSQYRSLHKEWRTVDRRINELKSKIEKGKKHPTKVGLPGIGSLIVVTLVAGVVISIIFAVIWGIWLIVEGLGTPYEDMKSFAFIYWIVEFVTRTDANVFLDSHPWLTWFIGFGAVGLPLGFIFALYSVIGARKDTRLSNSASQSAFEHAQKHMLEWENELKAAEKKYKLRWNQMQQMEKSGVMADHYFTWTGDLLKYLQDGRADTLKEAINLLEADFDKEAEAHERARHRKRMEDIASAHAAAMQSEAARTREATERAASAAEDAAFWSQAETFIVANEIDKAKKKK